MKKQNIIFGILAALLILLIGYETTLFRHGGHHTMMGENHMIGGMHMMGSGPQFSIFMLLFSPIGILRR